jgi:hypothetical protein
MEDPTPKIIELKQEISQLKEINMAINAKLDKLLRLFEIQSVDAKKISKHTDLKETVYNRFSY